jgi:hypothetical protein
MFDQFEKFIHSFRLDLSLDDNGKWLGHVQGSGRIQTVGKGGFLESVRRAKQKEASTREYLHA